MSNTNWSAVPSYDALIRPARSPWINPGHALPEQFDLSDLLTINSRSLRLYLTLYRYAVHQDLVQPTLVTLASQVLFTDYHVFQADLEVLVEAGLVRTTSIKNRRYVWVYHPSAGPQGLVPPPLPDQSDVVRSEEELEETVAQVPVALDTIATAVPADDLTFRHAPKVAAPGSKAYGALRAAWKTHATIRRRLSQARRQGGRAGKVGSNLLAVVPPEPYTEYKSSLRDEETFLALALASEPILTTGLTASREDLFSEKNPGPLSLSRSFGPEASGKERYLAGQDPRFSDGIPSLHLLNQCSQRGTIHVDRVSVPVPAFRHAVTTLPLQGGQTVTCTAGGLMPDLTTALEALENGTPQVYVHLKAKTLSKRPQTPTNTDRQHDITAALSHFSARFSHKYSAHSPDSSLRPTYRRVINAFLKEIDLPHLLALIDVFISVLPKSHAPSLELYGHTPVTLRQFQTYLIQTYGLIIERRAAEYATNRGPSTPARTRLGVISSRSREQAVLTAAGEGGVDA